MIYEVFKDKVERFPDNTAIVTEKNEEFTYFQANEIVTRFAHFLLEQGVKSGQRVAVLTHYESAHIWFYLALNRLGACYVPWDATDFAAEQLKADLVKLDIPHLFTDEALAEEYHFPESKVRIFDTDTVYKYPCAGKEIPHITKNEHTEEYIIFSSGSMSARKCILINHTGAFHYWESIEKKELNLKPGHKVFCWRSPGYDARLSEYLRAFIAGGTLYQVSMVNRRDIEYVISHCARHHIETILFISSILNKQPKDTIIKLKAAGIKNIIVTGDACHIDVLEQCEEHDVNLFIAYGQTETTFGSVIGKANEKKVYNENGQRVIPIPAPVGDIKYCIINDMLYIKTPFMSPGYIGDEEKNKETFVTIDIDGKLTNVIFTGDKFSKIGNSYCFLGRAGSASSDKLIGVMVSPQGIEDTLSHYKKKNEGLVDVCVVNKNDLIVAYIVITEEFNKNTFVQYIEDWIQPSCAPRKIIILNTIPQLTTSEKKDRRKLISRIDDPNEELIIEDEESVLSIHFGSEKEFYRLAEERMRNWVIVHPEKSIKIAKGILDLHHAPFSFSVESNAIVAAEFIYSQLGIEYDPAQNSFFKIKNIWENILKSPLTSVKRNFLLSGGDSIKAALFASNVKDIIDQDYTYTKMICANTITALSIFYGIHFSEMKNELQLVRKILHSEKHRVNYFFLPPISGDAFAYTSLANTISQYYDGNLYGLTLPGIFDEKMLEHDFEFILDMMVQSIEKIQEGKPLRLIGYSGGCFWVYHIARKFMEKGCPIAELHLMDGYPADFYNKLSKEDYSIFVRELFQVSRKVLNNTFYNENIEEPPAFSNLETLEKKEQVASLLDWLLGKVSQSASRNLIGVVKQNLYFMLDEKTPQVLDSLARLYYSKEDQLFHSLRGKVPGVEIFHPNYHDGGWNHYFTRVNISDKIPSVDHFDLIKNDPDTKKTPADVYFKDEKESIKRLAFKEDVPATAIYIDKNKDNTYTAFLVHLTYSQASAFYQICSQDPRYFSVKMHKFYDAVYHPYNDEAATVHKSAESAFSAMNYYFVTASVNAENKDLVLNRFSAYANKEIGEQDSAFLDALSLYKALPYKKPFTLTLDFMTRDRNMIDQMFYRMHFNCFGSIEDVERLLKNQGNRKVADSLLSKSHLHYQVDCFGVFSHLEIGVRYASELTDVILRQLLLFVYLRVRNEDAIISVVQEKTSTVLPHANKNDFLHRIDRIIEVAKNSEENKGNDFSIKQTKKSIRLAKEMISNLIPDWNRIIFLEDYQSLLTFDKRTLSSIVEILWRYNDALEDESIKQNERGYIIKAAYIIAKHLEKEKSAEDIYYDEIRYVTCFELLKNHFIVSGQDENAFNLYVGELQELNILDKHIVTELKLVKESALLSFAAASALHLGKYPQALDFAKKAFEVYYILNNGEVPVFILIYLIKAFYKTNDYLSASYYAEEVLKVRPDEMTATKVIEEINEIHYQSMVGFLPAQQKVASNLLAHKGAIGISGEDSKESIIVNYIFMSVLCLQANLIELSIQYCQKAGEILDKDNTINGIVDYNRRYMIALLATHIFPCHIDFDAVHILEKTNSLSEMGWPFATLQMAIIYGNQKNDIMARTYLARSLVQDLNMMKLMSEDQTNMLRGVAYLFLALWDMGIDNRKGLERGLIALRLSISYGNQQAKAILFYLSAHLIAECSANARLFLQPCFISALRTAIILPPYVLDDISHEQIEVIMEKFTDKKYRCEVDEIANQLIQKMVGIENVFSHENAMDEIKHLAEKRPSIILHGYSLDTIKKMVDSKLNKNKPLSSEEIANRNYIDFMHKRLELPGRYKKA